jgi:hypothetical protein
METLKQSSISQALHLAEEHNQLRSAAPLALGDKFQ